MPQFRSTVVALFLLLPAGCNFPHRVKVTETGAPRYRHVEVDYRVNGPRAAATPASGATVELTGAEPAVTWKHSRLKIEYPHPDGAPDLARATVWLSNDDSAEVEAGLAFWPFGKKQEASSSDQEVWVLDFPKQELDLLLIDLADSGFFDDQRRSSGDVDISIAIDRGRTAKTWTSEPRLEDFLARVRREGWLVGFAPRGGNRKPDVTPVAWEY